MNKYKKCLLQAIVASSIIGTGCATKSDLQTLTEDVAALKAATESALKDSADASVLAKNNQAEIARTQVLLNNINQLIQENRTIMERMFGDSLKK